MKKQAVLLFILLALSLPAAAQQQPKKHEKLKFFALALVPHALNTAYFIQYRGCYHAGTCIDHGGRPAQFYAGFSAVNVGFNVLGYFAKRDHNRFWPLYTLGMTPLHVYDLATHK